MSEKFVPCLVDCTFVQRVTRADAEELGECYGAAVEMFSEDGMHARYWVEAGQEKHFMEYCLDDVMVKSAGRCRPQQ